MRNAENRARHVAQRVGRFGTAIRDSVRGYTDEYAQRVRDLIEGKTPVTDEIRDTYKTYRLHRTGITAGYQYPNRPYNDGIFFYTRPTSLADDPKGKVHEAINAETTRLEGLSPEDLDAEVIEDAKAWAKAHHIKWEQPSSSSRD